VRPQARSDEARPPCPREGRSPLAFIRQTIGPWAQQHGAHGRKCTRRSASKATAQPGRGTECRPETGLKGRPQESQHSAAVRRETGSSAPGEGHGMFLREGSSSDGLDAPRLGEQSE
jgi:hypothetical protein